MRVWRIFRAEFSREPLSGLGASLAGGRWNSRGREVIYTADSLASAVLEVLVNLEGGLPAAEYAAAEIQVDDGIGLSRPPVNELQAGWDTVPAPADTAAFGDRWFDAGATVGLVVPSAVVRGHVNVILNPAHSDFRHVSLVDLQPFVFDQRLLYRFPPAGG